MWCMHSHKVLMKWQAISCSLIRSDAFKFTFTNAAVLNYLLKKICHILECVWSTIQNSKYLHNCTDKTTHDKFL